MRDRFLRTLARLVLGRSPAVIAVALALTLIAALVSLHLLRIRNSRYDLISPETPTGRRYQQFVKSFGVPDSLIICAQSYDRADAEAYCDALAARLRARKDIVREVFYRKPIEWFRPRGLLFLPQEQLQLLAESMSENEDLLQALSSKPTLAEFFSVARRAGARQGFSRLQDIRGGRTEDMVAQMRMLRRLTDGITLGVKAEAPQSSPWSAMVSFAEEMEQRAAQIDPYLTSVRENEEGVMFFMFVQGDTKAVRKDDAAAFVREVRRIAEDLREEADTPIRMGLTGAPALSAEEARQTKRDMAIASVLAILSVGIIFIIGFHELVRPVLGIIVLSIGIGLTFGLTTVTIGYLNLITITFTVILVGLGIDFSIHLLARYEEELQQGLSVGDSLVQSIRRAAPGILTGAVTTALSFYATMFCNFRGFAQLGFIGGSGILICCAVCVIVLPALLYRAERPRMKPARTSERARWLSSVGFFLRRPRLTLLLTGLLTVVALIYAPRTRDFDFNILNLQARGAESVRYEEEMFRRSDEISPRVAVALVDSLDELPERSRQFKALKTVKVVNSVLDVVPRNQEAKLPLIKQIRESIPKPPKQVPTELDLPRLRQNIEAFHEQLRALELALRLAPRGAREPLEEAFSALDRSLAEAADALAEADSSAIARVGLYQRGLFQDLWEKLTMLESAAPDESIGLADLPDSLRRRFVGRDGRLALYVQPKGSIWDRPFLRSYVEDLQSVDEDVTGGPVLLYEMSIIMLDGYKDAALYAGAVVLLVVLVDFRCIRSVLFAVMPLVVGVIWMLGAMGLIGLHFNLANLVALPLILGIGVASGIHMVHRYHQEGDVHATAAGTGRAVFLSLLTTICGFGSMSIARHRGLSSLGLVLTLGVAACLFNAVIVLPMLMQRLFGRRRRAGAEAEKQSPTP